MIFPPMLMRQMFAVVTLLSVGLLHAQNLEQLQDSFKSDLESALTVLSAAQKKIADEKVPLSKKINELEARVIEKRQELSRLERSSDNQLVELNALKTQTKGLNEEKAYLNGLISEYAQLFETRIHITEVDTYQSAVRALQSASKNPDLSPEEFADAQVALLDASIDRLESLIGGKKFTSDALAPSGVLENGEVILMGPFAVFASSDTASAGLAQLQLGSPKPTVVDLGAERTAVIRQLSDAGKGEFPVDPTMGNALKIAATQDNLIEHMKKGGPVMLPIVGLGLAAVLIALMKWLQLSSIKLATPADLQLILSQIRTDNAPKALKHIDTMKGYVGDVLKSAVENRHEKKEYLEEIMYEKMLSAKPALERWIPLIALTAATAPLLGLLGTVTGMINTFNMITVFGTGDPRMLSGGISEALITTKFGLVVAVPALICHAFVTRKVKGVLGSMEQISVGFINGLSDKDS
ncbi:MAG: MotA/TolQ/ExbB proton channel family protein [Limisphaerales bacterium]|nr:MotA/TolQ/ExbB proton channel family protein [Verrucomicrobiae bacterium]